MKVTIVSDGVVNYHGIPREKWDVFEWEDGPELLGRWIAAGYCVTGEVSKPIEPQPQKIVTAKKVTREAEI